MNNAAFLKGMGNHFAKNAESHRNYAACATGLSACMKSLAVDFTKGDKKDFFAEAASQHESDAERCTKMAAFCDKCATMKSADPELIKALAAAVMQNVDEKLGNMMVPSNVQKVFRTEDPMAPPPGFSLVPRAGQATPPTDLSCVDPAFRNLFQE